MITTIVTDIEGTTSSLSFVKDVLFPYARVHIAEFIRNHGHEPEVSELLHDAAKLTDGPTNTEALIEQMIRWIDQDQKVTPLKSLQGLIWEHGYRQGDFKGHIYADAAQALRQWHDQAIKLYVYSSGSVYAQKLLFKHTEFGDLTSLFSGYFDTHIGGKKEPASYSAIAEQIKTEPENILFLSDITEELEAALNAGFKTCRLVREGKVDDQSDHDTVSNFFDIKL
ncbi:acireductone synthase [Methylotuvimicrobium buryatense]|uniref:Enolase-phosphatase E1 n=1 Tax=Methylotuvimicrobium buryatense TaxID=95641 RepID=A0A4P9UN44_METBY|nr:acireductone synthase [Methylotuvimicrobium buryatense]QCW81960.1 acireductone synthase [Methylotuvimicrobium buryatense]